MRRESLNVRLRSVAGRQRFLYARASSREWLELYSSLTPRSSLTKCGC
jgi:hypothetical protein